MPPRAKVTPAKSRWRLDEAVRGETAVDSRGRIEFDFPAGEVTVDVGSHEEAVLARVLTQTAHAVPVDDAAHAVALLQPVTVVSEVAEESPAPDEPKDDEISSEES